MVYYPELSIANLLSYCYPDSIILNQSMSKIHIPAKNYNKPNNTTSGFSVKVDTVGKLPSARFGHTITLISPVKVVLFGGAVGDTKNFNFSNETFILNIMTKIWTKLESKPSKLVSEKFLPSARAAHAACPLDNLQMIIHGGSTKSNTPKIGGELANDDLYFFDLKNGEEEAQWSLLNTQGKSPGKRYGHTICLISSYTVVLFGGNTGVSPSNDVFIITLQSEPFTWIQLNTNGTVTPSPRLYHAAGVCKSGLANGMMIVFGGRDGNDHALNDAWGLRRHRNGTWDWIKAPYHSDTQPKERYNVRSVT